MVVSLSEGIRTRCSEVLFLLSEATNAVDLPTYSYRSSNLPNFMFWGHQTKTLPHYQPSAVGDTRRNVLFTPYPGEYVSGGFQWEMGGIFF